MIVNGAALRYPVYRSKVDGLSIDNINRSKLIRILPRYVISNDFAVRRTREALCVSLYYDGDALVLRRVHACLSFPTHTADAHGAGMRARRQDTSLGPVHFPRWRGQLRVSSVGRGEDRGETFSPARV